LNWGRGKGNVLKNCFLGAAVGGAASEEKGEEKHVKNEPQKKTP